MANLNIVFSPGLAGVGSYLLPALATPVTVANVTVSGVSTQSAAAPIVDQADPGRLGLNSDYIIPVLVRAVQQLAERLEALEEMIDG